jgi:hypothetical protein
MGIGLACCTDISTPRHGRGLPAFVEATLGFAQAGPGHPRNFSCFERDSKTWMPGTRPGMTQFRLDEE